MTERILLAHGGGGELTRRLITDHIRPRLANPVLDQLTDGALLDLPAGRVCVTTDASVVTPLFFPGGDIGRLAVSGTVNDLAVMGARPLVLTQTLVIEEGLELALLDRVLDSVAATAREAGVQVVAGDTKVVERRGEGGGLFISTSGLGVLPAGIELGTDRIRPGDAILLSGRIAEHGLAVMACREGLALRSPVASDVAPLQDLCAALCALGGGVRFLRDPTRGGLAGLLADLAEATSLGLEVREEDIPITASARQVSELLGLDPLAVANEGKVVVVCDPGQAQAALAACRALPSGRDAALIGSIGQPGRLPLAELLTRAGGRRVISRPWGEELPRIC